jgi:hypothetical protein
MPAALRDESLRSGLDGVLAVVLDASSTSPAPPVLPVGTPALVLS